MTRRVFLHVGAPKTGTTFLQHVLWNGRGAWSAAGLCYPLTYPDEHLEASVDVLNLDWLGRDHPEWTGKWAALAVRARRAEGDVVISNELLAAASVGIAARIAADFEGFERHLVFTVRSYSEMLTSDWQEQLKYRHHADWPDYLHDVLDAPESHFGRWVPEHHDVIDVLRRWRPFADADRVHVIVNKAGAAPQSLWRAFAEVTGLPVDAALPDRPINPSIGLDASRALARLNARVSGLNEDEYRRWVVEFLAGELLPSLYERNQVTMPAEAAERVHAIEVATAEALRSSGYDVVGDPATLVVQGLGDAGADRTHVPADEPGDDTEQVVRGPELVDALARLVGGIAERDRGIAERDRQLSEWEKREQSRRNRRWRRAVDRVGQTSLVQRLADGRPVRAGEREGSS